MIVRSGRVVNPESVWVSRYFCRGEFIKGLTVVIGATTETERSKRVTKGVA